MIRLLLLVIIAVFTLPSAAHALCGSPPCSYSVTVRGAQSGVSNSPQQQTFTITSASGPAIGLAGCDPNPPHNGGPTNGSCFNKQIMNMDFSGATQSFATPYGNFDATNVPSWLYGGQGGTGCTPANPLFYATAAGNFLANGQPCSDFTVVTDPLDGQKSFRMAITNADLQASTPRGDTAMTSFGSVSIPAGGYYLSYQWHIDPTSLSTIINAWNQNTSLEPFTSGMNLIQGVNNIVYNGTGVNQLEHDTTENHVPTRSGDIMNLVGNTGGGFYNWNSGPCVGWYDTGYNGGVTTGCSVSNHDIPGYNPSTGWITVQERMTEDASGHFADCIWINGDQQCETDATQGTVPSDDWGAVNGILWWGPSDWWSNPGPQVTLATPIYAYFRNFQVFTCPAATTAYSISGNTLTISGPTPNPCAGVVLTTSP